RSSGGYLLDEPPDMTPSFPRTGVSGHAGAVQRLTALPGWELVDGKLRHTFGFGSFDQSMKFVAKIAAIADKFNHHPDICVHNKRSVRLTCWTRQMHCLTRVDFDLAEAFSAVHDEQCSQQVAR
ncbi:hypothetical protein AO27_01498, partial [Mycobacterium tuberculosis M1559]